MFADNCDDQLFQETHLLLLKNSSERVWMHWEKHWHTFGFGHKQIKKTSAQLLENMQKETMKLKRTQPKFVISKVLITFLLATSEQIVTWHQKWDPPRLYKPVDDLFRLFDAAGPRIFVCEGQRSDFTGVSWRCDFMLVSVNSSLETTGFRHNAKVSQWPFKLLCSV